MPHTGASPGGGEPANTNTTNTERHAKESTKNTGTVRTSDRSRAYRCNSRLPGCTTLRAAETGLAKRGGLAQHSFHGELTRRYEAMYN